MADFSVDKTVTVSVKMTEEEVRGVWRLVYQAYTSIDDPSPEEFKAYELWRLIWNEL